MSQSPSAQTPLDQHSLYALEDWLIKIGAVRSKDHSSMWCLTTPSWTADIELAKAELLVTWHEKGNLVQRTFPYSLYRNDIECAIIAGP